MPCPDSALLQGCINLQIQQTAMFACENFLCVLLYEWGCDSQSLLAVCEVSGGAGSFTAASRLTGTLRMFLLGDEGGGRASSSAANTLKVNGPRSSRPPFTAGSGVWKC